MVKKLLFIMAMLIAVTNSCTHYSHERVQELCMKVAIEKNSHDIDDLMAQANCMLDNAIDIIESYVRSNDKIEKADMITTLWDDAHFDDMKLTFDILRAPDVQAKMNRNQLEKFEALKDKFVKLKYRVDLM